MPTSFSRLFELVMQSASDVTTSGLLLKLALIACSLFATVQLLTMLNTRYDDDKTSSKSFFLSLVVHCCLGLGWATAVQHYSSTPSMPGDSELPRVGITLKGGEEASSGFGTGDDDVSPEAGTGNRPVWTRSVERTALMTSRIERPGLEPSPVERPVVQTAPSDVVVPPEVPDLPSRPDEPPAPPTRQAMADIAARTTALPSANIDTPATEARPEASVTTAAARQAIRRPSSATDAGSRIEPQRGASERTAQLIEDGKVLSLPTDVVPEAGFPKPVGAPAESIRRRATPSPFPADIADTGSNPASTSNAKSGDRPTGKFTRAGNRNANDPDFDPNPPGASRPSPRQPASGDERMVASRGSVGSVGGDFPGDSPTPAFIRPNTPSVSGRAATRAPETYRARRIEQRRAIALKNGGSIESERAVEASLHWMADMQEADGSWSSARHGGGAERKDPGGQGRKDIGPSADSGVYADSGVTGLVVLSFLGAGYTHDEGQYSSNVKRAIDWLIKQQQANGYLGGKATHYDMMYCHAIAAFALAEAYGMQSDPNAFPELRDSVRGSVRLIAAMQNEDGGWRYGRGGESDMSMFGWQLMALKSAVNAGITVPEETRRGMTKFLQARSLGSRGGLAGYKLNERPTPAMTAEALFCRQMFNVRQSDAASQEAVGYLRQNLPRLAAYDEYYWYYGTLAMFQYDGEPWEDWNSSLRDMLISQQRTGGPLEGSWDPKGKWSGIGGRLYATALSTMSLEVYYRFLRIYQTDE